MRVFRGLDEVDHDFGPCALTIGNFDGVHAGHRTILRRVVALAREQGWKAAAMTFQPHPLRVVAPERAPSLLTTPDERPCLMAQEGIEEVLILPFTPELSRLEPDEFISSIVVGRLDARAVIVGDNFRFGHRHAGDTRLLAELGAKYGFKTEALPAIRQRGRVVSSSELRRLIREGNVSLACRFLQRPYGIAGEVVRGFGIGSKQTVPTLNLPACVAEILPANGIYVTRTTDLDACRTWPSVTYIGNRPTFDAGSIVIETNLLSKLEGRTPKRIKVEFLFRIRDDRKFDSAEALKVRILKDVARAKRYFHLTGIC